MVRRRSRSPASPPAASSAFDGSGRIRKRSVGALSAHHLADPDGCERRRTARGRRVVLEHLQALTDGDRTGAVLGVLDPDLSQAAVHRPLQAVPAASSAASRARAACRGSRRDRHRASRSPSVPSGLRARPARPSPRPPSSRSVQSRSLQSPVPHVRESAYGGGRPAGSHVGRGRRVPLAARVWGAVLRPSSFAVRRRLVSVLRVRTVPPGRPSRCRRGRRR